MRKIWDAALKCMWDIKGWWDVHFPVIAKSSLWMNIEVNDWRDNKEKQNYQLWEDQQTERQKVYGEPFVRHSIHPITVF